MYKLEFQHIRIQEVGVLSTKTGNLLFKDPCEPKYDKATDVLQAPFGNWRVHLIETNIRKYGLFTVGCILQHEASKTEVFPSILTQRWRSRLSGSIKSSMFSVVNESDFYAEVPAAIKEKYDTPFAPLENWYDWCRQETNHAPIGFINGGCVMSKFEFGNHFNVLTPSYGKEKALFIGIEFFHRDGREFQSIFNTKGSV
ncbi:MAG: hypothetical protein WDZ35_15190 [Crocinitomicaceae bacterium]